MSEPATGQRCTTDGAAFDAARRSFWAVFAAIGAWLLWSALTINIDFDDGYSTIVNSQSLLGITSGYFWQRGPGMAALLMPAEWVADRLHLPAFDVRTHHLLMAALHLLYLLGTWRILVARFGARPEVVVALMAALLTPVFFSYAPFISHDIFPGMLTLLMARLATDYMNGEGRRRWLLLVAVGTGLAVIKQTYALVWVAVLVAQWLLPEADGSFRTLLQRRKAGLALAALLSGCLTWLIYAAVLADAMPGTPFWLRPLELVVKLSSYYDSEGGVAQVFYPWIYLRNLSAYGILAMALLLPGLYLSLRHGDRLQRSAAIACGMLICAMQATAFKEVRYLAFLAPLFAFMLVPVVAEIWKRRKQYRWALLAILFLDLARSAPEAGRLTSPFYREAVTGFLEPLPLARDFAGKVIVERALSFVSPEADAYFGDRYHRITHVTTDEIRILHDYSDAQWLQVDYATMLDESVVEAGDFLIMATDIAVRRPPFRPGNSTGLHPEFIQATGVAEWIDLELVGGSYTVLATDRRSLHLLLRGTGSEAAPIIGSASFDAGAVMTLLALDDTPTRIRVLGFRLLTLCRVSGCERVG
jgi:hypothetical protein